MKKLILIFIIAFLSGAPLLSGWKAASLPPEFRNTLFLDIFFLPEDLNYGWACGQRGEVVRTTDGGLSWSGVIAYPEAFLESIQFLTPMVGYTSGPGGFFKSLDGGVTWFDLTPIEMMPSKGWGLYFIDVNNGVYIGDGCGDNLQLFGRTTNGGLTWNIYIDNVNESGLSDAIIREGGKGVAVGSGWLYRSTDYGFSWRRAESTGTSYWHEEITWVGNSHLIPVAGKDCSGSIMDYGELRFSVNNGQFWRSFLTGKAMFGTYLVDSITGWGVGTNGSAYFTSNAGRTWELRNCGVENVDLDDVTAQGDVIWTAGYGLYRYIDDIDIVNPVSLIPVDKILRICPGDSVLITASDGPYRYTWSHGAAAKAIWAREEGVYVINAYDTSMCQTSKDTVLVQHYRPQPLAIQATQVEACDGDTIEISVLPTHGDVQWSNGETAHSIRITASKTIYAEIIDSNGCRIESNKLTISFRPPVVASVNKPQRTTICLGDSIKLIANGTENRREWSNGDTSRVIVIRESGKYAYTGYDMFGCLGLSDTVMIHVIDETNKAQVLMASPYIELLPQVVGLTRCMEVRIRNNHSANTYTLSTPALLYNVRFAIPPAQLPFVVPPNEVRSLTICCMNVDTGFVFDTLLLPDTCSIQYIPLRAMGLTSDWFSDSSRCNINVEGQVSRIRGYHYISPPYPQPANDRLYFHIGDLRVKYAAIRDVFGAAYAIPMPNQSAPSDQDYAWEIDIRHLPQGLYILMLNTNQGTAITEFVILRQ